LENARQHVGKRSKSVQEVYWWVEEGNGRVHKNWRKRKRQEKYNLKYCLL
jgi:hypothetical protein